VVVTSVGSRNGYELWGGSIDVGAMATGALSVSVLGESGEVVDVAFF